MSFVQRKKKSVNSNCRPLISDDLMIDFRADFIPLSSVEVNWKGTVQLSSSSYNRKLSGDQILLVNRKLHDTR